LRLRKIINPTKRGGRKRSWKGEQRETAFVRKETFSKEDNIGEGVATQDSRKGGAQLL